VREEESERKGRKKEVSRNDPGMLFNEDEGRGKAPSIHSSVHNPFYVRYL
jgi:hypothetical protein